jgi:hypothetical protein
MIGLLCFVSAVLASSFKSKLRLEAEKAVFRLAAIRSAMASSVREQFASGSHL